MNPGKYKFRKDDPMRYLHEPRRKRVDVDEGDYSDASHDLDLLDEEIDRDRIRSNSQVVPAEELE